jgi:hypothetical protein
MSELVNKSIKGLATETRRMPNRTLSEPYQKQTVHFQVKRGPHRFFNRFQIDPRAVDLTKRGRGKEDLLEFDPSCIMAQPRIASPLLTLFITGIIRSPSVNARKKFATVWAWIPARCIEKKLASDLGSH